MEATEKREAAPAAEMVGNRADGDSRAQGTLAGTTAGEAAEHCGEPVLGKADAGRADVGAADAGKCDVGAAGPVSPVNRRGGKGKPATPTVRRVGTFTFGAMMVAVGVAMLVSMFFPGLDMTLALQLSPLILVSLGIEVLLSARGDGRVRYDWVGMLLSCIIVCAALALFFVAWYAVHYPHQFIYW